MSDFTIRPLKASDVDRVVEILEDGRATLAEAGVDQWQGSYPNRQTVEEDLASGQGRVILDHDQNTCGYYYFLVGEDPAYIDIKGSWETTAPYGVIHRLASAKEARGRGVGRAAFELAAEECRRLGLSSLRVDTHEDNETMHHLISQAGFTYRGHVWCEGDRLAFEKPL